VYILSLLTRHAQYYHKIMQKLVQKQPKTINLNFKKFEQSIKSGYTRVVYTTCLKKYFEFPGSSKFINATDTRKIEDHITDFITSMKKEGKSFRAIYNYVSAICKYYRMSRVSLDTKHIREYLPEFKKSKKDRPYEYEEIRSLLDIADERMRTVVLLLASTGIRIGAIPGLKLRNIEKVEIDAATSIYKITVYEGFKEEYITFTTPECTAAIDSYLKMRERYGEKLNINSFLIREQFDIRDPFAISKCKEVKANTLTAKLIDLAVRAGIRQKEVLDGKPHGTIRNDVPIAHGFRKFFTSQLVKSDVKSELRWLLEGHNLKANDPAYVRTQEEDLLEQYQKGIDNLTIDPANRMLRTIEILKIEKSKIDILEEKIQKLERKYPR
jgi:integrase